MDNLDFMIQMKMKNLVQDQVGEDVGDGNSDMEILDVEVDGMRIWIK